jgi:fatty-acyl-CoA synthase
MELDTSVGLLGVDTICGRFSQVVHRAPDKVFVHLRLPGAQRAVTFAQAWDDFVSRAAELDRAGVRTGGVVLIFLPQGWDGISYYFGAMLNGCVPSFMPCPSTKQDPELYWKSHKQLLVRIKPAAIVSNTQQALAMVQSGLISDTVQLIVTGPPLHAKEWKPSISIEADATALLQHSSGTTGLKKGVMLSHRAVLLQLESYSKAVGADTEDVIISWLPLYHDMGLIACLMLATTLGQSLVLLDPFHWIARPATLFQAIAEHRGTLCWLPNFAFEHLARVVKPDPATMSLQTIKAFINCSEPCQVQSFRRFQSTFSVLGVRPDMLQVCYAMAETTFAVSQTTPGIPVETLCTDKSALRDNGRIVAPRPGAPAVELLSNGKLINGATISIRDENGHLLPDGNVGEIYVAADFLFDGYYRLEEQTAERLSDGLYRTRDRGFVYDGQLFVLGRMDDLLILNGRNFHATEVEGLLISIDGLKPGRAIAFTLFNTQKGTNDLVIVAETAEALEPDPGDTAVRHAIRSATFESLGIYPAEVSLVPPGWLIKTSSGKISRGANAEKFERQRLSQSCGTPI